jgi:hypothetical protein
MSLSSSCESLLSGVPHVSAHTVKPNDQVPTRHRQTSEIEPVRYKLHRPTHFQLAIASVLNSWMRPYVLVAEKSSLENPVITLDLALWVSGIQQISRINDINLICSLIYLKRLVLQKPHLPFCWLNVHRLFLVSCMIASKFLDDVTYKNKDWALISGHYFCLAEVSLFFFFVVIISNSLFL